MKTEPNHTVQVQQINENTIDNIQGLTKRELMAIEFTKAIVIGITTASGKEAHGWSSLEFAEAGLMQADALITALNK